MDKLVLEPVVAAYLKRIKGLPFLFELGPAAAREAMNAAQSPRIEVPGTTKQRLADAPLTIFRPSHAHGPLPVILYLHGGGWVTGNDHTHDRIARELAHGACAAVAFVNYSLAPETRYPTAIEEAHAAAQWVVSHGAGHDLDPLRLAVAGDSAGGNLAAALTLRAKAAGDLCIAGQVLICPVLDAEFDTLSYRQFAQGHFLRRDAMQWYWDQYVPQPSQRDEITASPLRATAGQLAGLPPALVITAEVDVLRDEGEAYATKLREAGVPTIDTRYRGVVHDFAVSNALRPTRAAQAAIEQSAAFLTDVLQTPGRRPAPAL